MREMRYRYVADDGEVLDISHLTERGGPYPETFLKVLPPPPIPAMPWPPELPDSCALESKIFRRERVPVLAEPRVYRGVVRMAAGAAVDAAAVRAEVEAMARELEAIILQDLGLSPRMMPGGPPGRKVPL